ncbi:Pentatricopeptide repeat-containing protein [Rhynchospora pubera]|uniref:Pentatricopeptide repeat-containing protein n=1 Tax=Rhynchospora pubera TaxID=906938 RepID=A0AAV8BS62_9POAL|nr:Pentatricopeptide repeat-containing protein [Rhynchospora pubera]
MAPSTNAKSLLSLIQTSSSLLSLQTLHAATLHRHPSNLSFTAALASRYSLLGFPQFSHYLLSTLPFTPLPPFTSTFSFNLLLRAYTDSNLHDQALSLYSHLLGSSPGTYPQLEPDRFTFPPVTKSCGYLCDVEAGVRIHKDAERLGLVGDLAISNALIFMYGKCGDVDAARKVFDGMSEKNVVSWTAMIGCLGRNGKREEGFRLFKRMVEQGIRPNRATILNVIPCAVNGEEADELYSFVIRNGLQFDLAVQNSLVGMFVRCKKVGFARQMFDRMPVKDLVSWSSMIEGYGQNDMYLEALQLFRDMSMLGVKPDSVTVLGVIRACANSMLSCLTHARFIHGFVIRNFLDKNLVSETALLDLYVKRGSLTYAS